MKRLGVGILLLYAVYMTILGFQEPQQPKQQCIPLYDSGMECCK
jgi:hypothetical protein